MRIKESVFNASGELKEERDQLVVEGNINQEKPLKWTGRFLPKKEFFKKFAFGNSFQLSHVDGLTYDFLYEMAKELEEKDAFLILAAGEKANANHPWFFNVMVAPTEECWRVEQRDLAIC